MLSPMRVHSSHIAPHRQGGQLFVRIVLETKPASHKERVECVRVDLEIWLAALEVISHRTSAVSPKSTPDAEHYQNVREQV